MPSIRKRIGYLPSISIQEIISKLAEKGKLSQSKMVGILVEEALIARGVFDIQNTDDVTRKSSYRDKNKKPNSQVKYSDLDELISDKGITYNRKKYNLNSDDFSSKAIEPYNKALFEQFRQFVLYQQMINEK